MESLEIAGRLRVAFPEDVLDVREFREQVAVLVRPGRILELLTHLREVYDMRHLQALCGVDNSRRKQPDLSPFEVVYQLYSINRRHGIRLRAMIDNPEEGIDSAVSLWTGANWLERETWDLVGIHFKGHPDLRRILLPDDWQGHPLRKDYPVKLPSRGREEWQGLTALRKRAAELDALSWQGGNKA
ncbi:MAG: NADH-quinone oxidoreductase subunit C/D [Desulfovibrio sp.]